MVRKILPPLMLIIFSIASVAAPDWKFRKVSSGGCEAQDAMPGVMSDGTTVETELHLVRMTDGNVAILYVVLNPDDAKGFGFGEFEGPNAPASKRKLTSINV